MRNEIIENLEKRLIIEDGNITIGDVRKARCMDLCEAYDAPLENILISLYNLAKINQYKIKELETNLDLLVSRIYDAEDDFIEIEVEEITDTLDALEIDDLLELDIDVMYDVLYLDDNDFELREKKQDELFNKIKFPTKKMNETLKKLIAEEIEVRNRMIDIRNKYKN